MFGPVRVLLYNHAVLVSGAERSLLECRGTPPRRRFVHGPRDHPDRSIETAHPVVGRVRLRTHLPPLSPDR
jgi:hypothetical protein